MVKRVNKTNGLEIERFKVPIVYAPKEKYYARLRADPDLERPIQVVLPRMSFEITTFSYDASRKQNSLLRSGAVANTATRGATQYMSVPYDINFDLQIYARNVDDGTHIIEQIIPYFNPDYTVTIDAIPALGFLKDVPIILNSVSNVVEHEGNFDAVRYVSWTLSFTMKANYYGPVQTPKIIRKVLANIYNDETLKAGNIVRMNTSVPAANGNFKIDDIVYQGSDYNTATAYGYVLEWNKNNLRLVLGGTQGQFKIDSTIRAVSTNAVCTIESFDITPLKLVEIKIEPDPLDAEPSDDFGYTTTITEWPETENVYTADSLKFSADSTTVTADRD
jgi:hypothetical protein